MTTTWWPSHWEGVCADVLGSELYMSGVICVSQTASLSTALIIGVHSIVTHGIIFV